MEKEIDEEKERKLFEERAFAQYYLSTIQKNTNIPKPRISGALDFVSINCKNSSDFLAKNDGGSYIEDSLNPAWWAWQERAKIGV